MNDLKIIYAGTPEYAAIILQALVEDQQNIAAVLTQPDRPAGRGQQLQFSAVKKIALQHQLVLHQPNSLKDSVAEQMIHDLQSDIMIVVAYGLLIPKHILQIPRLGCINVHPSLLPRWRGATPIQSPILAGDKETGVTIMQMDAGLDTGPMISKASCDILATDTYQTLHDRLAKLGANLLLETLHTQNFQSEAQDNNLSCYAPKISKQDALIDWNQSAAIIDRKIRAYNPLPVAFTYMQQQAIKIWQATIISDESSQPPGTIIAANKNGIDVATGQGILRILTLQLPGKKVLPAQDILNAQTKLFAIANRFSATP